MKLIKSRNEVRTDTKANTKSIISEGLTFKEGNLEGNGSITINCVFIGDIHIDDIVVVDEAGSISGNIYAKDIIIRGTIEGNLTATGSIHICDDGVLNGDITCDSLIVDSNAAFSGTCNMSSSRGRSVMGARSRQDSDLVHTS